MQEFLTIPEFARLLRISERTVHRRLRDGTIRRAAVGGRLVRIAAREIERITQHNTGTTGNEPVHTNEQVDGGQID